MHYPKITPPPALSVEIVRADGSRLHFDSLEDLAGQHLIRRVDLSDVARSSDPTDNPLFRYPYRPAATLRRIDGERLYLADVYAARPVFEDRTPVWWRREPQPAHLRRRAPVAGTGRRGHGSGHRYPRTLRTLREQVWTEHDEDLGGRVPPVRRADGRILTARDDPMRGDYDDRSWKHYRGHQWKPAP